MELFGGWTEVAYVKHVTCLTQSQYSRNATSTITVNNNTDGNSKDRR